MSTTRDPIPLGYDPRMLGNRPDASRIIYPDSPEAQSWDPIARGPVANFFANLGEVLNQGMTVTPEMLGINFGTPENPWNPWIIGGLGLIGGMLEPGPDIPLPFLKRIPKMAKGNTLDDVLYDLVPDRPPSHWSPEEIDQYRKVSRGVSHAESPFALQVLAKDPEELSRLVSTTDTRELGWWINRFKKPWGTIEIDDPLNTGHLIEAIRVNTPNISMDHEVVHMTMMREMLNRAYSNDEAKLEVARAIGLRGANASPGTAAAKMAMDELTDDVLDQLVDIANSQISSSRAVSEAILNDLIGRKR